MGLFVAAFLVLCGFLFALKAIAERPVRAIPLVLSALATLLFVAVRNHYDLEDETFLWTFAAFLAGACVATFATTVVVRQPVERSATYGIVAAGLMLPMFLSYYVLLLLSCLVTGCGLS